MQTAPIRSPVSLKSRRYVPDQLGQGGVIIENDLCAKRFRSSLPVAASIKRKRDPGFPCGFSIDLAVANEQRFSRPHVPKGREQRFRMGLALGQGVATDNDREKRLQFEVAQHRTGRTFWLVGADRKTTARRLQIGQG